MADNAEQAVLRIRQATEAIQTLPFFGREKLVWLKNVNFLADSVTGRSAAVQDALEDLKEVLSRGMPSGVRFLLSASEVDKRRSFYKSLGKFARVEQFDRIDPTRPGWEDEVELIVHRLAADLKLRFEPEALEVFIRLAGADGRQLRNELEKIDLYLGDRRTRDGRGSAGFGREIDQRRHLGAGNLHLQAGIGREPHPAESAYFPRRNAHRHFVRRHHPDRAKFTLHQGSAAEAQNQATPGAVSFQCYPR